MTNQNRILYLEKLRILALLLVLYTHSNRAGVVYYEQPATVLGFWVSLFMLPISQCCVVLFFMISGAVLLDRQESLKKTYLHRVLPMAIVTALFVLIQYIQKCFDGNQTFSVINYSMALYSGGSITEHWFLYAYLSFLMLLPFLQGMTIGVKKNIYYRYLFILMLAMNTFFPMWEAVSDWEKAGFSLPLLANIVFYPLMGHYVEKSGDAFLENKKVLTLANVLGILLAVGNCLMNYHSLTVGEKTAYMTTFLPYFSCLIFWNMKIYGAGKKYCQFWSFAGAGVFGTYLIEPQLRHIFDPLRNYVLSLPVPYLANLFVLLLMAFFGIIFTNLVKKLPGMKLLL